VAVIGGYIVELIKGTPPAKIAGVLLSPFGVALAWLGRGLSWFDAPARLSHFDVLLFILAVIALAVFGGRKVSETDSYRRQDSVGLNERLLRIESAARAAEAPQDHEKNGAQALLKFDPEKFTLTPPRCRALLALLHRIDSKTSLNDLHASVVTDGSNVDTKTSKAQVQQDMDDAADAGIVSIERIGDYTQYFRLAPTGRDWVLSNENKLKSEASKGMAKQQLRY
jgi:hypothetical protein